MRELLPGWLEMRQMAASDIDAGLRFCRASGWNQLAADWGCFLQANPAGCRVAMAGGEVGGTVATLRFEDRFSWISMLLVAPELRGRGIGSALLMEALRVLDDMPCVRLDATPAGKQVYDKCGFEDEYPLVRMRAETVGVESVPGVRPMDDGDVPALLRLDREVFGADRSVVLNHLRVSAPEYGFVTESGGTLQGFVLGRHGFRAGHVGPVVARDEEMARALVSACLDAHRDRPTHTQFIVDAPEHNAEWSRWLESVGFRRERPFMRMFRGAAPRHGMPQHQFAIAGPEFG